RARVRGFRRPPCRATRRRRNAERPPRSAPEPRLRAHPDQDTPPSRLSRPYTPSPRSVADLSHPALQVEQRLAACVLLSHIGSMTLIERWRLFRRGPAARLILLVTGWLLVVASPVVGVMPGPGGLLVFAAGLALLLKNSRWVKR